MFFVSGNLKTAVGRSVADGTSGLQVLFAQFLNDDGAGSRFVAEDAVEFGVTAYLFDQFLRKRRAVGFEMSPTAKPTPSSTATTSPADRKSTRLNSSHSV